MNHHFKDMKETQYIFDLTLKEMLWYDFGEGQTVALLEDVIRVAGKKQFINLEVKTPQDPRQRERYQYKECIRLVHELVMMHGIQRDCCVSSFNHELLAELERLNQIFHTQIDTIYLYNYYDNDELPHPDVYSSLGKGINISSVKLTREVVEICHAKGKQVGVWIDRDLFCENEEFYFTLYSMGVDFFCSDFPHLAI